MIHTYNEYRLGDNLVHLNYLRKVCKENSNLEFTHHVNPAYIEQLTPLVEYMPISLQGLSIPSGAQNAWIGRDNYFYNHPLQHDWVAFYLEWFDHLSNILEISSPMACKEDLWFDYPALNEPYEIDFDVLVINSVPTSNQLPGFNPQFFEKRVRELSNQGLKVVTTAPTGMVSCTLDWGLDVTGIGAISKYCQHIEGVATGPMWTTFNIFNQNNILSRKFYCAHQNVNLTENTQTINKL